MQRSETNKDGLFKKTLLLMTFFLIMLFISYELLEAPPRGFISMKIVDRKEDENGFYITLSISNNSNEKSKGILLIMLGYEDSTISENSTFHVFSRFKVYEKQPLQLLPKREEMLKIFVPLDRKAKRILMAYLSSFENWEEDHYQIVLRKEDVLWVQTWIGG
ncbi:MAG: hypothetical protein RMI79_03310 [Nitrososphaerota archaeon]|nr:hypothetical protein [Nitrososphaerota archaeon]